MARNEMTSAGPLNQILQKRYGIKGQAPALFMASEFFPMLSIENDRPEWGFLKGERWGGCDISDAAVGGQFSHAGISNPSGSGVLAVCRYIWPYSTIDLMVRTLANVAWDLAVNCPVQDLRYGVGLRSTVQAVNLTQVAQAGTGLARFDFSGAGAITFPIEFRIVLPPGAACLISPATAGVAVQGHFQWYERAAEPGELGDSEIS